METVRLGGLYDGATRHQAGAVWDKNQLCPTIDTMQGGNREPMIIEEKTIVAMRGRNPDNPSDRTPGIPTEQRLEPNSQGLCNTLTSVQKDNLVMETVRIKNNNAKDYEECVVGGVADFLYPSSTTRRGRVQENGNVSPTLTSENSGVCRVEKDIQTQYRIRKLSPLECWRLMGFSDEDFHKAKWTKEKMYLEGGDKKCVAKLKVVKEKQRHTDLETSVLCTTKDLQDMEILKTITLKSEKEQENVKTVNVNIVIEPLVKSEHLECATNIIKCIDYMGMHFILIQKKEKHQMDIIAQEKTGNTNTEKCMKITTESNLDQNKLYTILTLFALIMKSRIFTATIQQANIKGYIRLTTDCENNIQMRLSNLEMECIKEQMSNSSLYKQAGNSIVVDVLEAIFKNFFRIKNSLTVLRE